MRTYGNLLGIANAIDDGRGVLFLYDGSTYGLDCLYFDGDIFVKLSEHEHKSIAMLRDLLNALSEEQYYRAAIFKVKEFLYCITGDIYVNENGIVLIPLEKQHEVPF